MPIIKDTLDMLRLFPEHTVVQKTADEEVSIEVMIAKLRDVPVANSEQQIELQAGIAYLSLFSDAVPFAPEAERLLELIDEDDGEQLDEQIHAILHLADSAGIANSDIAKIVGGNRNIAGKLCRGDGDFGLGRVTNDFRILGNNFYRWKMSLACYELIRDKASHNLAKHLAVVPVVIDQSQSCLFVQESSVVVLVATWLTCELQQKGIDMNSTLKSIERNHQRIYEEALLEAGMPFRYPDQLLTISY